MFIPFAHHSQPLRAGIMFILYVKKKKKKNLETWASQELVLDTQ